MKSLEADFEKNLALVAPLCNCYYIKIPDVIPLKGKITAHKRPFDGVITTPNWNWCVECKINYPKLKPHQKAWQDKINAINGKFIVLRKIFTKGSFYYRIESNFGTWQTTELKDIFEFCKMKHYKGE